MHIATTKTKTMYQNENWTRSLLSFDVWKVNFNRDFCPRIAVVRYWKVGKIAVMFIFFFEIPFPFTRFVFSFIWILCVCAHFAYVGEARAILHCILKMLMMQRLDSVLFFALRMNDLRCFVLFRIWSQRVDTL